MTWRKEVIKIFDEIDSIRKTNPPILEKEGWTDTYWDGSFGPMHHYQIWRRPAAELVLSVIARENQKSGEIQRAADKRIFGTKHTCGKEKCYWHD